MKAQSVVIRKVGIYVETPALACAPKMHPFCRLCLKASDSMFRSRHHRLGPIPATREVSHTKGALSRPLGGSGVDDRLEIFHDEVRPRSIM